MITMMLLQQVCLSIEQGLHELPEPNDYDEPMLVASKHDHDSLVAMAALVQAELL